VEFQAMPETRKTSATAESGRFSVIRLVPMVAIAAGLVGFFALGLDRYLSFETLAQHRETIMDWTTANHALAVICFIGAYFVAVMLSLPGAVWMTIAGGFLFGALQATLFVVLGATLGAAAIFLAARYALGDYLRAKAGPAMRKMEKGFQENALSYLLVLRLVPLFPFWLVNLVPAFLGVPLGTYILGTFFGIIPGSFVYASVGNGLGAVFEMGKTPDLGIVFSPQVLGPIAGLAVLSLIPIGYKKLKAKRVKRQVKSKDKGRPGE
jgi:uncharacterized membrane protein YdjX (TVP38/TMEM64 family)